LVAGLNKDLAMPLAGERLTPEQVGLLRAWIDQGLEWSEPVVSRIPANEKQLQPGSRHWAFISPERPPIPKVKESTWVNNPIDAFVLAKLEGAGIRPSTEADRSTLIRRVSLDLIGLPPTPEQIEGFLADERPDAYERLVDRLLASPRYGEKWALHWLDRARFGESDGYQADFVRPHAWRWRHWVIDALNRNMPFDQFTIEQLAGDLLPDANTEQKVATGFQRNTLSNREGGFPMEMDRVERVLDRTSTMGTVWLGLSLGCARCHDHKFDPISQKDFFQLSAFFNSASELDIEAPLRGEIDPYLRGRPEYNQKRAELLGQYKVPELQSEWEQNILDAGTNPDSTLDENWKILWDEFGFELDGGQDIVRMRPSERSHKQMDKLSRYCIERVLVNRSTPLSKQYKDLDFKELLRKLNDLDAAYPALNEAYTIADNPSLPRTHVLIRGDYRQPGIEVRPDTPSFLPPLPSQVGSPTRLHLARWLVSRNNPLTARVTVNGMWQELFSRGLVETAEDFGTRGQRPTHPELLDWLAVEFMDSGWDVKAMHKLIVTSATYKQSSTIRVDLRDRDPDNKVLARQSRFRLPAELIRDATLTASGLLDSSIGGKSIRPFLPSGVTEAGFAGFVNWPVSQGMERYRRGVYIFRQRTVLYPQLVVFDSPNTLTPSCRRERSTNPLQALTLLNDPVFFEAAQGLAARILRERPGSMSDRINYAFEVCLARSPRPEERERLVQYQKQQQDILSREPDAPRLIFPSTGEDNINPFEVAVWVGISGILLNLEEFITRE
jgi:hypothetical protein